MSPPRKPSHARKAWDMGKWPMVLAALIAAAQQIVAMRGDILKQNAESATTASSVAAMQKDLNKTMARVFANHDPRLVSVETKLRERPERRKPLAASDVVLADSTVRSPGPGERLWRAASAPPKAVWHVLKAMFWEKPKDGKQRSSP